MTTPPPTAATTALYIGRFQPFHKGHLSVVQAALKHYEFLVIGIGSAEDNFLPDNPFTARERWQMISAALHEAGISPDRYTIIPVRNINHYALWVDHVSQLVPPFSAVYTGSKIVKTLFTEHGQYTVHDIKFEHNLSATQVRHAMRDSDDWEAMVPRATADVLKSMEGEERIKVTQSLN